MGELKVVRTKFDISLSGFQTNRMPGCFMAENETVHLCSAPARM